ncbi:MAG: hypothetical protein V4649_12525 [Bacteroidota bacterium]
MKTHSKLFILYILTFLYAFGILLFFVRGNLLRGDPLDDMGVVLPLIVVGWLIWYLPLLFVNIFIYRKKSPQYYILLMSLAIGALPIFLYHFWQR